MLGARHLRELVGHPISNDAFPGVEIKAGISTHNKLPEAATAKEFLAVQTEGKRRRISAEIAREHAEGEFEKYRITQDRLFQSDFDTFVALEKGNESQGSE